MPRRKKISKRAAKIENTPSVEPPTTAAIMMAVGGLLIIISAGVWASIGFAATAPNPQLQTANQTTKQAIQDFNSVGLVTAILGLIGMLLGVVVIISGLKINVSDKKQIKKWSKIAIIAAVISLSSVGGFIIGAGFAVIGGIIGLTVREY